MRKKTKTLLYYFFAALIIIVFVASDIKHECLGRQRDFDLIMIGVLMGSLLLFTMQKTISPFGSNKTNR